MIEGANGALWMQADGALLAYNAFEFGQGEVLHLYDTGTDVHSTPSLDPERRTSGGPTGSGRALFLPTSGGGLIGPSLAEGRVAFAVYQSVNTQSDETDVILAYRGAAPRYLMKRPGNQGLLLFPEVTPKGPISGV